MVRPANFHRAQMTQLSSSSYRAQIPCLVQKVCLRARQPKVLLQSLLPQKKRLKSHCLLRSFRLKMIWVLGSLTFSSTWRLISGLNSMTLCFSQECILGIRKVILAKRTFKTSQYPLCNKSNFFTVLSVCL